MATASPSKASFRGRVFSQLLSPVDGSSLAVFRMSFGAIMLWQAFRYLAQGLIDRYWIEPIFHFTYPGFAWVQPWSGGGMYFHVAAMGGLAALFAVGLHYRLATVLFFFVFTYLFLLEHALYLNHYYFVCLISFLLIFVPAHRCWSVDAIRNRGLRPTTVPFWSVAILRAQMAIVYFFGGIAKLHSDWFQGRSVQIWLEDKSSHPVFGPLFERPETFLAIAWTGVAFDLLIVPFLLWKRTRVAAFIAAVCFHLLNAWFFNIGIFPWFSIAATTLFFEPDWPRAVWRSMSRWWKPLSEESTSPQFAPILSASEPARRTRVMWFLGIYMGFQVLIPLRHWLYPGDVNWTEEGHEFSWQMKLRDKSAKVEFLIFDPQERTVWQEPVLAHLKKWQARAMAKRPELIRQFAHYLARVSAEDLGREVKVRVNSTVSLNGAPEAVMIDPEADLGHEPYRIGPAPWIVRHAPPATASFALQNP